MLPLCIPRHQRESHALKQQPIKVPLDFPMQVHHLHVQSIHDPEIRTGTTNHIQASLKVASLRLTE